MNKYIEFVARISLAGVFLYAGIGKISAFEGTQAYMASQGVPEMMLPLVIALEIIAPIMIIIGWRTRIAAIGLAGFTLAAAFLFHFNLADQMQSTLFMKNIMITGGLLLLYVHGSGKISFDAKN